MAKERNSLGPTDEELKQAFKEETGKDPTAKELEEFKAQAMEGDVEDMGFTKEDARKAFKETNGREPTAKELE